MKSIGLVEQYEGDCADLHDLGVAEWHQAVRLQVERGFDFQEELTLGEQALEAGRVNEAFLHLEAAESKLAQGGEWELRERWLNAAARLYHSAGRIEEVLAVYRAVLQMAQERLGEEHPLTKRLDSKLGELEWAHSTGQAARLQELLEDIEYTMPDEPADHLRNIQLLAEHYRTWSGCMDVAKWCQANGESYWAEVALKAAQSLGGDASDPRQIDTLEALVALYEQNGKPWLAEREIRQSMDNCGSGLGFYSQPARSVRKMLKTFLAKHRQV
jgi:hypothetical protein